MDHEVKQGEMDSADCHAGSFSVDGTNTRRLIAYRRQRLRRLEWLRESLKGRRLS